MAPPEESNLDGTRVVQELVDTFKEMRADSAVTSAIALIPKYDGTNMPLRHYVQSVENAARLLTDSQLPVYLAAVKNKLSGWALEAVNATPRIDSLTDLASTLRKYFAPGKTYSDCYHDLEAARREENESLTEYFLRIKRLQHSAEAALKAEHGENATGQTKLTEETALKAFIKGLGEKLTVAVAVAKPADIEKAFEWATTLEKLFLNKPKPIYRGNYQMNLVNTVSHVQTHQGAYRSDSPGRRDPQRDYHFRGRSPEQIKGILRREDGLRNVRPSQESYSQEYYRDPSPGPSRHYYSENGRKSPELARHPKGWDDYRRDDYRKSDYQREEGRRRDYRQDNYHEGERHWRYDRRGQSPQRPEYAHRREPTPPPLRRETPSGYLPLREQSPGRHSRDYHNGQPWSSKDPGVRSSDQTSSSTLGNALNFQGARRDSAPTERPQERSIRFNEPSKGSQ